MKLRKGTPGRGGESRIDSFSYTPVPSGLKGSFSAHLAGEPYWCEEAHEYNDRIGPTQPCMHWMTEGALSCARCRKQPKVSCLAWVPLYREQDGQPILVIVHKSAADLLAPLKYPDSVLVGRVTNKSSVFVRKSDNALSFKTDNEQRKRPVNIAEQLLNLWNMPELTAWLRHQKGSTWNSVSLSPDAVTQPEVQKHSPAYRAAAARAEAIANANTADLYGDVVNEAVRRTDEFGHGDEVKNGKPKPR